MEEAVSQELDLDRTLWFLALENVFTDEDSYINKGGTDYYLYWDVTSGLMTPIEYDGNSTLLANYASWSPFRNATNQNFPLLYRLLNVPAIRQRYLAHIRTILDESFNVARMTELIDAYAAQIDPYIAADPKKMMSYAEFVSGVSSLKSTISSRYNTLSDNSEIAVRGLDVTGAGWAVGGLAWATPSASDAVTISATVSGSAGVAAVYAYVGEGSSDGSRSTSFSTTAGTGTARRATASTASSCRRRTRGPGSGSTSRPWPRTRPARGPTSRPAPRTMSIRGGWVPAKTRAFSRLSNYRYQTYFNKNSIFANFGPNQPGVVRRSIASGIGHSVPTHRGH